MGETTRNGITTRNGLHSITLIPEPSMRPAIRRDAPKGLGSTSRSLTHLLRESRLAILVHSPTFVSTLNTCDKIERDWKVPKLDSYSFIIHTGIQKGVAVITIGVE